MESNYRDGPTGHKKTLQQNNFDQTLTFNSAILHRMSMKFGNSRAIIKLLSYPFSLIQSGRMTSD